MQRDRLEAHAAVFQSLADETRLEILLSICRRHWESGPVTFSEAMDAAGFEDSGHFSYHLDALEDLLVFEHNGTYLPTTAAYELLPVVLAGRLIDYDRAFESPTVGSCLRCGHPLVAHFEYRFLVTCSACENWVLFFPLAADVAADSHRRSLAVELDRTRRAEQATRLENRCPQCGGETIVRVRTPDSGPYAPAELDVCFDVVCENCNRGPGALSAGQYLLGHPTVRAYCRDHGIDPFERPQWEHAWVQSDVGTTVRSREPWEIETYAYLDGCRLVAVIEDDGSISHLDHVPIDGERESGGDRRGAADREGDQTRLRSESNAMSSASSFSAHSSRFSW